jgi:hypothetical protein
MTTRELKRLNHYPEFKTDAGIDAILDFKRTGNTPQGLNSRQATRYRKKYGNESGFVVENNALFYRPVLPNRNPDLEIHLEVVKPSQREVKIKEIYEDVRRGLGTGLDAFYHQVAMSYLNIPKPETDAFLRKQGNYLVSRIPKKAVNRPILTKTPNERWAVDLIDMRAYTPSGVQEEEREKPLQRGERRRRNRVMTEQDLNHGMKYIFTCVDMFSGKVWARPIPNRMNDEPPTDTLARALHSIGVEADDTVPHTIQCDNEFNRGSFERYCRLDCEPPIRLIPTTSYTPTSNGRIERVNREIRKKIRAGMIESNSLSWVDRLDDYIENINSQQGLRNHVTPNQLWKPGYHPPPRNRVEPGEVPKLSDNVTNEERLQYNRAVIRKRAEKLLAEGRPPPVFHVGDLVRVRLLATSNEMRKLRKNNIGWNKVAVHYTPEIFQVHRVYPQSTVRHAQYAVTKYPQGDVVMASQRSRIPKKYFGTELIHVPRVNDQTSIDPQTIRRAEYLNRIVKNWAHVHN